MAYVKLKICLFSRPWKIDPELEKMQNSMEGKCSLLLEFLVNLYGMDALN